MNKLKREILRSAFLHYVALNPNIMKTRQIEIRYTKSSRVMGFVRAKKNDRYIICLSSRFKKWDTVSTLFHELTHVLQFLSGKLSHNKKGDLIWKGKKYDYLNCPFEIQARKNERKLLKGFKKLKP